MKINRVFAVLTLLVLAACVCVLWPGQLRAQSPSAFPYAKLVPNDSSTGTVQFTLTCLTSAGNAVECTGGATNGYTGICVANCGKNGSAWIAFAGIVPLTVDGSTTLQHYIQISATAGEGHDTGAVTYPTTGGDVIGVVQKASTGAASVSMVDLFPPEIQAASGGGGTGAYTQICKTVGGGTVNLVGTPTYTVTATCTIPANTLNTTGKCLHMVVAQSVSSGTTTTQWQWTFGGTTTAASSPLNTSTLVGRYEAYVCETGANAQSIITQPLFNGNTVVAGPGSATTAAATTSASQTFAIQGTCTSACTDVITPFLTVVDSF